MIAIAQEQTREAQRVQQNTAPRGDTATAEEEERTQASSDGNGSLGYTCCALPVSRVLAVVVRCLLEKHLPPDKLYTRLGAQDFQLLHELSYGGGGYWRDLGVVGR